MKQAYQTKPMTNHTIIDSYNIITFEVFTKN